MSASTSGILLSIRSYYGVTCDCLESASSMKVTATSSPSYERRIDAYLSKLYIKKLWDTLWASPGDPYHPAFRETQMKASR